MDSDTSRGLKLLFCVIGIYICFLTWGVLQERISTIDYRPGSPRRSASEKVGWLLFLAHRGIEGLQRASYWMASRLLALFGYAVPEPRSEEGSARFESFIFLNLCQSVGSMVIAFFVVRVKTGHWPLPDRSSLVLFLSAAQDKRDPTDAAADAAARSKDSVTMANNARRGFPRMTRPLLLHYLRVSLCFSCASPFGYASLKYIGYVTMNLGKSCKLLPLVFIGVLFKKQRIDRLKLLSVLFITAGVTGFMLFDGKAAKKAALKAPIESGDMGFFPYGQWLGIALLLANLLLDGAMNTWQEELFKHYAVSSFHMMYHMNWISVLLMSLALASGLTNELPQAIRFILSHPPFLLDLCLFSACGALGQAVVFYTIENFGAVSLVTVTVTRKLFTILLSVFYFGHALNTWQWFSVGTVFVALGLEAYMSKQKARATGRLLVVKESMPHAHIERVSSRSPPKSEIDSESTASIPLEWNRPASESPTHRHRAAAAALGLSSTAPSIFARTSSVAISGSPDFDSSIEALSRKRR